MQKVFSVLVWFLLKILPKHKLFNITIKKKIRIRINDNNQRDLMAIIVNEIDKINNSYERIKYYKLIPCN